MTEAETYLADAGVAPGCRWTPMRKAAVLTAMKKWPEHSADIMEANGISAEEVSTWAAHHNRDGIIGLKATQARRLT